MTGQRLKGLRSFRGFVIKEFYHIFRDKRTMVILFGMPVIQLILFGFAVRNEIQDIKIAFVDFANDHVTGEIKNELRASGYFDIIGQLQSENEVEQAFQHGLIKEAILFEPDFARRLTRDGVADMMVITDATDPNTAKTMLAYTTSVLQAYQANRADHVQVAGITAELRMRFNPELKSVFLFVPGLMALILMLVCALMTSITITREKELGTMEILLVSPLRPGQIIVGKVIPYLFLSFVNVVTILVLARLVFHVPIRGSVVLLLAECLLFILTALSLGLLISARCQSQQTATMIALAGLLLPTVILSGFIFPISSMPVVLQWLSHIVPAKWFLIIVRDIMLKGVGIEYFWKETLVLAAMTLLLLIASVKNFKVRLE